MVAPGAQARTAPAAHPPQVPPQAWTWEQVKDRLELNNPTLLAGKLNISELQAQEITAHFRPNPKLTLLADQIDPFPGGPSHGPFAYWLPSATVSYLHERAHKRELRTESAKKATAIASFAAGRSGARICLFSLRSAFVQTLQAKAVLQVSKDNLEYYDHVLEDQPRPVSGGRHRADRSGPAGVAAGAIRVGPAVGDREFADGEDPDADAVE